MTLVFRDVTKLARGCGGSPRTRASKRGTP